MSAFPGHRLARTARNHTRVAERASGVEIERPCLLIDFSIATTTPKTPRDFLSVSATPETVPPSWDWRLYQETPRKTCSAKRVGVLLELFRFLQILQVAESTLPRLPQNAGVAAAHCPPLPALQSEQPC